jgi:hypothetical protein
MGRFGASGLRSAALAGGQRLVAPLRRHLGLVVHDRYAWEDRVGAMAFKYQKKELCAVDEEIGLRIEADRTFYDCTDVPLKLSDVVSGGSWSFPFEEISGFVVCETPDGPREVKTSTSATIPHREIERLLPQIMNALRRRGREPDVSEAFDVIMAGALEYLTRGGAMLDFVPDFKVTWT